MAHSEEQVREALRAVIDPEVGLNIVDMGLVYKVESREDRIFVTMTLTTRGCPMGDHITGNVKQVLASLAPAPAETGLELVWDPPWEPSMIEPAAWTRTRRF